jgi:hypothetical protein
VAGIRRRGDDAAALLLAESGSAALGDRNVEADILACTNFAAAIDPIAVVGLWQPARQVRGKKL